MAAQQMVVKLQIPIATLGAAPTCLIYNKDRSVLGEVPVDEDLLALFGAGEFKIYHWAHLEGGNIVIGDRCDHTPNW